MIPKCEDIATRVIPDGPGDSGLVAGTRCESTFNFSEISKLIENSRF